MSFTGFTSRDFDVFLIDGLDERMAEIKKQIRPKLEALGERFSSHLSERLNEEMYAHVARHARRTVNPPDDTWVAWAANKRGYKKHPHFQVGLWQTHLFVWFALIYESPQKAVFADQALPETSAIKQSIPGHFVWSVDHTKPEDMKHEDLSEEKLTEMLERLKKVKKSEILCGLHLDRNDPVVEDGEGLIEIISHTFETLTPLYRLAQPK